MMSIVTADENVIVTKWNTLKPKTAFHHGCSCYFQIWFKAQQILLGKMAPCCTGTVIFGFSYDSGTNSLTVTDLLADVVIYPDGEVQVADLDELADALERRLAEPALIAACLRRLHHLLTLLHRDKLEQLQSILDGLGL